jgi:hypothetical protein
LELVPWDTMRVLVGESDEVDGLGESMPLVSRVPATADRLVADDSVLRVSACGALLMTGTVGEELGRFDELALSREVPFPDPWEPSIVDVN